ncbi:MAG: NAD(P)H-hydrate dehydratase [Candidatus Marinimicrobia bacterium]|nr:NAD(P)H-hydrate dehydratase [Candidatus Neomarinimicrobiota bacterium]|tara:strand:- start:1916 stop:3442 length:1527 start_codon:yes stop_codon:yes gene_type:complete
MDPVLSKYEARLLDKLCESQSIISSLELINNAGKLSAQYFVENIDNPFNQRVLVLAGKGNNGADAFVMHYYLLYYGINSRIFFLNKVKNKNITKHYKIEDSTIIDVLDSKEVSFYDWVVDGIFGIGLNRNIGTKYNDVISLIKSKKIISIDIPSGLDCDTGLAKYGGNICHPRYVLSMGYFKNANIINEGKEFFPVTKVLDIAFPKVGNLIKGLNTFIVNNDDIKKRILKDSLLRNKYDRLCTMIVGSKKYIGAGIISSKSAINIGAGYVNTVIPEKLHAIYSQVNYDAINISVGNFNKGIFKESDFKIIKDLDLFQKRGPLLIGPGLGDDLETAKFTARTLKYISSMDCPCVLDASAFVSLYKKCIDISDLPKNCVLTPHYGEFKKIFPDVNFSFENPIDDCKKIIHRLGGRVLILKGPTTIIIGKSKKIYIQNNSNSLLAVAGSGDVLSGIILGLISIGYSTEDASILSVYIHNQCSIKHYSEISRKVMTVSNIIDLIPRVFDDLL